MVDEFFILSLRWTREDVLTWWCPKNSGYTSTLTQAGRYSRADVEARRDYYDNGHTTLAIPCGDVEPCAVLIVRDLHLRKLTGKRFQMATSADDDEQPCPDCGQYPHSVRLGLRILGDVESESRAEGAAS